MTIRVLLVDDQEVVRVGFRMILTTEPDIHVVGEAGDGERAVELARALQPDVVLMDVRMPRQDGLTATAAILAEPWAAEVRVLVLTTFEQDDYLFEALRAGASGFLLKTTSPEDLVRAVRVVADGGALLGPSVTRRVIEDYARRPPPTAPPSTDALTEREAEVLMLVATGLSNAQIARRLVIGEATVKTHVSRVLAKLGLRDRVQAVVFAYESGLVQPGQS
ncbi:MAG TPA: response regulator transcription factor [Pseudonocardiaceae bacterium]